VDPRQGKRSLPPDEEKKEAFNFPFHLTPSQNPKEQASPSPFSNLIMSSNQNTTFFPTPHGQITSTSKFINSQDPSQATTNQGKLIVTTLIIITITLSTILNSFYHL